MDGVRSLTGFGAGRVVLVAGLGAALGVAAAAPLAHAYGPVGTPALTGPPARPTATTVTVARRVRLSVAVVRGRSSPRVVRSLTGGRPRSAGGRRRFVFPAALPDGRYRILVQAYGPDGRHLVGQAISRPFALDRTAPTLGPPDVTDPVLETDQGNGAIVSVPIFDALTEEATMSVTVSDAQGTVRRHYPNAFPRPAGRRITVAYRIDSYDDASQELPPGDYTVTVRARDAAGNVAAPVTAKVTVVPNRPNVPA